MGSPFAVRLALRCIARYSTFPVPCPLLCGRCPQKPPLCITQRHLSSVPDGVLHNQQTSEELQSLLDMGFTDIQAGTICETLSKSKGGNTAKNTLSTLSFLILLGLNPSSALKLVEKCPELYSVRETHLQQNIGKLRKLGFVEGSLQRVVSQHPQILTTKIKNINMVVQFLKEKCAFTTQQVTDILRDAPAIIHDDLDELEYKFQYVYFRMGLKQTEMIKAGLFRFTLDEVRNRHCFLERRGMYETPDKKGRTSIINPKLGKILNVAKDKFVTDVARATNEEFDIFQRLVAREWKEEERLANSGGISDDDEDYEDGDDEDDEEEGFAQKKANSGKMGYMKKKKK